MAARKTASESLAPKKPVATAVDEAPEALEGISYDSLSPEMKAILDEADKIKAEADAERQKRNATITAFILARYKIMKETGENADEAKAKFELIAELESKDSNSLTLAEVSEPMFDVVEALCGKHMAADFLKKVEGNKIAFVQIMKDVIRLAGVGKA